MKSLSEVGNFVGIPAGALEVARFSGSRQITLLMVSALMDTQNSANRPRALSAIINRLQGLPALTLQPELLTARDGEESLEVKVRVNQSDAIVWHTTITAVGPDRVWVADDEPSGIGHDVDFSLGPGIYEIKVERAGIGNAGMTVLSEPLGQVVVRRKPAPPPPPPPPPTPPTISVTFSGSIQDAKFHVTGSGFLPNRPPTNQGVAIRVVDANALLETRREFTASSSTGTIDHVVEGDLTGLTLNAAGIATVAISATDGRPDPSDKTGFLWSNTVRKDFSA